MACGGGGGDTKNRSIGFGKSSTAFEIERNRKIHEEFADFTDQPIPGIKYHGVQQIGSDEVAHKFEWEQHGWKLNVILPMGYPNEKPKMKFVENVPIHADVDFFSGEVRRLGPGRNIREIVETVAEMMNTVNTMPSNAEIRRQIRPDGVKFPLSEREFHYFVGSGAQFARQLRIRHGCHLKYAGMKKNNKNPHFLISGGTEDINYVIQGLKDHLIEKKFRPPANGSVNGGRRSNAGNGASASSISLSNDTPSASNRETMTTPIFPCDQNDFDDSWPFPPASPTTIPDYAPTDNLIDFGFTDSGGNDTTSAPGGTATVSKNATKQDDDSDLMAIFDGLPKTDHAANASGNEPDWKRTALMVLASSQLKIPDELKNVSWNSLSDDQRRNLIGHLKRRLMEFVPLQYRLILTIDRNLGAMENRLALLEQKLLAYMRWVVNAKSSMDERRSTVENSEKKADEFRCPICMTRFKNTAFKCNDTFCEVCAEFMIKSGKNCPICRQKIEGSIRLYV